MIRVSPSVVVLLFLFSCAPGFDRGVQALEVRFPRGVSLGITATQDGTGGQRIVAIAPNSPISAKLQVGDVITDAVVASSERKISTQTPEGLFEISRTLADGERVTVTVLRPQGKNIPPSSYIELSVTLTADDIVKTAVRSLNFTPGGSQSYTEQREQSYSVQVPYTVAEETKVLSMNSPDPAEKNKDGSVTVDLFYATDRALIDGEYTGAPNTGSDPIRYGKCEVTIPPNHVYGKLEKPKWWKLELKSNPNKHVVIHRIEELANPFVWFAQRMELAGGDKRRVLLFVHGYNTSFYYAAKRTAQMHVDLNFQGIPMCFSWPADGQILSYMSDTEDILWSTPHITTVLRTLSERDDVDEIYVIAHSMGNRGVTRAMQNLANAGKTAKLKEIILAAPDVNANIFKEQIVPILGNLNSVTLYASANDKLLNISNSVNKARRLGQVLDGLPVVFQSQGFDVVDASSVDTDFLGHSDFANNRALLTDIFHLIGNKRPIERNLRSMSVPQGSYWRFP